MKPVETSQVRIGLPTRLPESHGRTDGRTDVDPHYVSDQVEVCNARREANDDAQRISIESDVLAAIGTRHPVVRTGSRDEIPNFVRNAVWFRDGGKCAMCGHDDIGTWHLDHITPWSAGGADDSTNLRVLCEYHNLERSNFVDWNERPKRPATWWCYQCWGNDDLFSYSGLYPSCHRHRSDRCRVLRHLRRDFQELGEFAAWHARPVGSHEQVAYCAHCDAPGLTRWVL